MSEESSLFRLQERAGASSFLSSFRLQLEELLPTAVNFLGEKLGRADAARLGAELELRL